jgi:hypothetical protein
MIDLESGVEVGNKADCVVNTSEGPNLELNYALRSKVL